MAKTSGSSMVDLAVVAARLELYDQAMPTPEFLAYVRNHGINVMHAGSYIGVCGVMPVAIHPGGRFEFVNVSEDSAPTSLGFVHEGIGNDGETVIDLVAWRLSAPETVLTMFGRIGMLGAWEAFGSAPYIMGGALTIHKTPLAWLQAGCEGAAIATPHVAARQLLDLPGRVAARDLAHGHYLKSLIQRIIPDDMVLVPAQRRAA